MKADQIFGYYSLLLDFDESKFGALEHQQKIRKLRQGIMNNYPGALPDPRHARSINRVGSLISPAPVAISLPMTLEVQEAMEVIGRKVTPLYHYCPVKLQGAGCK
jgi:hypothetical protein